jgi:hypothetical protein
MSRLTAIWTLALPAVLPVLLSGTNGDRGSRSSGSASCVECHSEITPGVVADWGASKHSSRGVECSVCHGGDHTSADDVREVKIPTPDTCGMCHAERVEQFTNGKHALAWAAMNAMPTTHWIPMALTQGMKGCGGCHKIGLKTEEEIAALKEEGGGFGVASCDACHTRHLFSVVEASQPQATCHMQGGDHEVRTAWGFLAVRLPMPDDEVWAADRATILQALGVLDPEGNPTGRLEVVQAADVARLTQEDWEAERNKMISICGGCHSENFARTELEKGDDMIREADHLLAEAIRIIVALYEDGILEQPEYYSYPYPDLLTFHDAPTAIEQKLFVMHLEHRMRAFQGVFHANPDYALWYGYSEMVRDLQEIKEMAEESRRHQEHHGEM